MRPFAGMLVRGLCAPGLALALSVSAAAAELPGTSDAALNYIRTAIETRDYEMLRQMVFWKDTGKIKKRIVRFHLSRALGRKIHAITWESFPEDGLDAIKAQGRYAPNMDVTNAVRVVFDEEPLATGKRPTAVFLMGKRDDVFRIGLVNRAFEEDDDD